MTITTTIQETKRVEKEITLPYFFKDADGMGWVNKVIDEQTTIRATAGGYTSISKFPTHIHDIAKGVEISEEEFAQVYNEAFDNIFKQAS